MVRVVVKNMDSMPLNSNVPRAGTVSMTHVEATEFSLGYEGTLSVLDNDREIAVFAPGYWLYAEVEGESE